VGICWHGERLRSRDPRLKGRPETGVFTATPGRGATASRPFAVRSSIAGQLVGSHNLRPPTDATPSRPYLLLRSSSPCQQFPRGRRPPPSLPLVSQSLPSGHVRVASFPLRFEDARA